MKTKQAFNPITGNFDLVSHVPQVLIDPALPAKGDMWVRKTGGVVVGGGMIKAFLGLGFPMLAPGIGGAATYDLSYRTKEGTTIRVAMS